MRQTKFFLSNHEIGISIPFDTAEKANDFLRRVDAGGKRAQCLSLIKQTLETFDGFFPVVKSSMPSGSSAADVINGLKVKGQ